MFDPTQAFKFWYKFTEKYQTELKMLKILHDFTDGVIQARRNELLSNEQINLDRDESNHEIGIKTKQALLDLLLHSTIDGKPLSNEDIREEVDTFMFEGHDTTTSGIAFCLYNLALHPEIQAKVFAEIQTEIGLGDVKLSLQELNKLSYLELVIKESLRLFPSVPYFARRITEETTSSGVTFPKGCNVTISPYLMGRDPDIFHDPLSFKPERFDAETTTEKINPYAYIPFSAGELCNLESFRSFLTRAFCSF